MKHKAFPGILLTFALLILSAGVLYLSVILPSSDAVMKWFIRLGTFLDRYDTILIGILVAVNVIELMDYLIYAKRDEVINANYEARTSRHLGFGTMFKQYFAAETCRGPYIFAEEEQRSAFPRIVNALIVGIVKFVMWLLLLTMIIGMIAKPDVYNYALTEGADYAFTAFVLWFFLNCSMFVYALYRILPLHQLRTYTLITYYSDGSSTSSKQSDSNIIAIVILAAILYLYSTAYYIVSFSRKLRRIFETKRLQRAMRYENDICVLNFYG